MGCAILDGLVCHQVWLVFLEESSFTLPKRKIAVIWLIRQVPNCVAWHECSGVKLRSQGKVIVYGPALVLGFLRLSLVISREGRRMHFLKQNKQLISVLDFNTKWG